MAKSMNDLVLDAPFTYIVANADQMFVCSTDPTSDGTPAGAAYTKASSTYNLGTVAGSPTYIPPTDGSPNGRVMQISQETGVPITSSGDAQHVVLASSVLLEVLAVTTITLQAVVVGNTVTIPAWDINNPDPV